METIRTSEHIFDFVVTQKNNQIHHPNEPAVKVYCNERLLDNYWIQNGYLKRPYHLHCQTSENELSSYKRTRLNMESSLECKTT